jgi:hypothetical protein
MFLSRAQVIVAFAALGLAFYVLELVRRRRLSEDFSLLWLVSSAVIALLGFSTGLLRAVTRTLGVLYESSTVFAAGIAFAVILLLYLSVRLSRLSQENVLMARELALLRHEIEQRGGGRDAGGPHGEAR